MKRIRSTILAALATCALTLSAQAATQTANPTVKTDEVAAIDGGTGTGYARTTTYGGPLVVNDTVVQHEQMGTAPASSPGDRFVSIANPEATAGVENLLTVQTSTPRGAIVLTIAPVIKSPGIAESDFHTVKGVRAGGGNPQSVTTSSSA